MKTRRFYVALLIITLAVGFVAEHQRAEAQARIEPMHLYFAHCPRVFNI